MATNEENESIYLFIIEEEYKRNKRKRNGNAHVDISGKAELPTLPKRNHASVIRQLKKMHPNFEMIQESESLQTPKEPKQMARPQIVKSSNAAEDLDLLASFPKMKTEEQELLAQKQDLLTIEQDLQNKLVEEIEKKKTAINNLKTEILNLQNRCKEIAQALGISDYK
ncbi:MAG: hypothetical protein ABSA75_03105 [Candidatus Bathyarchaeia archaeon]|jgi:hypothetical protein